MHAGKIFEEHGSTMVSEEVGGRGVAKGGSDGWVSVQPTFVLLM